jgi:hypothetical protein
MCGESFKQYWLRMGNEYRYVTSDEAERIWDAAQLAVIANTSTNTQSKPLSCDACGGTLSRECNNVNLCNECYEAIAC